MNHNNKSNPLVTENPSRPLAVFDYVSCIIFVKYSSACKRKLQVCFPRTTFLATRQFGPKWSSFCAVSWENCVLEQSKKLVFNDYIMYITMLKEINNKYRNIFTLSVKKIYRRLISWVSLFNPIKFGINPRSYVSNNRICLDTNIIYINTQYFSLTFEITLAWFFSSSISSKYNSCVKHFKIVI